MTSADSEEHNFGLLAYSITISLVVAFYSALMLQMVLRFLIGLVVKSLVPISSWLGVIAGALVGMVPVVLFVLVLRWLLPLVCQDPQRDESIRDSRAFAYLHYGLGLVAALVIIISLASLGGLPLKPYAKLCSYLQLIPLAIAGGLAVFQKSESEQPTNVWLSYADLSDSAGRLIWMVTDLVCYGLFFGLTAYVLCLSNVLNLSLHLSPVDWADPLWQHGLRFGMLLAIWRTPVTDGSRSIMTLAFLVDWLLEKIINPWYVPGVQLLLVVAGIAPFYRFPFGLKRALRIGFGLCAGRVFGRIVGALFLGEEGPVLLEPVSELVMTMWLLQTAPEDDVEEPT